MIDNIINYFEQYQDIFIWLGIVSIIMFVASLILVPMFLKKIPVDYFINKDYHKIDISSFSKLIIFILKNTLGIILILAGIIMLITPGQGIIAIIIGLFLMQFRGKYKLERKLVENNITFKTLNWIREKSDKPPFVR
jgi:ABC-type multidrug transport system fused ATPase/permease subunit